MERGSTVARTSHRSSQVSRCAIQAWLHAGCPPRPARAPSPRETVVHLVGPAPRLWGKGAARPMGARGQTVSPLLLGTLARRGRHPATASRRPGTRQGAAIAQHAVCPTRASPTCSIPTGRAQPPGPPTPPSPRGPSSPGHRKALLFPTARAGPAWFLRFACRCLQRSQRPGAASADGHEPPDTDVIRVPSVRKVRGRARGGERSTVGRSQRERMPCNVRAVSGRRTGAGTGGRSRPSAHARPGRSFPAPALSVSGNHRPSPALLSARSPARETGASAGSSPRAVRPRDLSSGRELSSGNGAAASPAWEERSSPRPCRSHPGPRACRGRAALQHALLARARASEHSPALAKHPHERECGGDMTVLPTVRPRGPQTRPCPVAPELGTWVPCLDISGVSGLRGTGRPRCHDRRQPDPSAPAVLPLPAPYVPATNGLGDSRKSTFVPLLPLRQAGLIGTRWQ